MTPRAAPTSLAAQPAGLAELAMLAAAAATYLFADTYLALATTAVCMIIFALSLDLVVGYAGINTLGHAAFFGIGAYAAGLYALHLSSEPISGLIVAAVAAAVVGLLSGLLVLRTRGLSLVMLTLAVASVVREAANAGKSITGGAAGLSGFAIAPIFGVFAFDLYGRTAFLYGVVVLAVVFALCRVVVASTFGLTIRGIKENPMRMRLLGVPIMARLVTVYVLSAALAGVAGALSAQVTGVAALEQFGLPPLR